MFIYLFLLVIIIDQARRTQFDENFVYLFLIGLLVGALLFSLQRNEVTSVSDVLLKSSFVDIFVVQVKMNELARVFSWLLGSFRGVSVPLNGDFTYGPFSGVGLQKGVINSVNQFFYTVTVLNFVYRF